MAADRIELNHTIVHARDKQESAEFYAEILGLPDPQPFGHFLVVKLTNGVSLDFLTTDQKTTIEHYAFLVSDTVFDRAFARIKSRGLTYWADPAGRLPNQINEHDGGRGLYFRDPTGHYLELITKPYGGG